MKLNFYDEIRQIITEELDIGSEEIKKIIIQEINQVVNSMVKRTVEQMTKGQDLETVVREAVKKELNNNTWGVSQVVRDAIRDVLSRQLKLTIIDD